MKSASDASRNTLHGPPRGTEYFAKNAWSYDIGVYLVALAVLTVAMMFLHALSSGLSGSDEGSHFLNGYMIWSYLKDAPGQNPMTYATNFYIHYPKISIGHWPPLYYAFLASFFGIVSHTTFPFFVVNLVVGALPALLIARSVRQVLGLPWAVLAGISYVLIPITLNNTVRLMLDQAIAGLCLFGALLWSAYSKRPSLLRGFAYAFVTAAAILVKGFSLTGELMRQAFLPFCLSGFGQQPPTRCPVTASIMRGDLIIFFWQFQPFCPLSIPA